MKRKEKKKRPMKWPYFNGTEQKGVDKKEETYIIAKANRAL